MPLKICVIIHDLSIAPIFQKIEIFIGVANMITFFLID